MDTYGYYFGKPNAAHETGQTIQLHHVTRFYEANIKAYDRADGSQILVGIKGSGKTDLRRYIETTDRAFVFNLDDDHSYLNLDAADLRGRSGRVKNTVALELLRGFAQFMATSKSETKAGARLKSAGETVLGLLKNVPDAVEVKTPLANVKLSALLRTEAAPIVQSAWRQLIGDVRNACARYRGYIMIDDAEDVFLGIESNPDFLEAVARAVHDINRATGNRLHVLLFLKYGVWRQWFENQREYDKVAPAVLVISWDHRSLVELIGRRIAARCGDPVATAEPISWENLELLWKTEFQWPDGEDFERFTRGITRYCVSGPRDVIEICNMAKSAAGSELIDEPSIGSVTKAYSEQKLYEIRADFGDVYPEVHRFVERVFQGAPREVSGRELASWIEERALLADSVEQVFRGHAWFAAGSRERLTAMMYEIGLYGIRVSEDTVVYSIERPNATVRELLDATLVVHPAFRPHLSIEDT